MTELINENLKVFEPLKIEILDEKDQYYQLGSVIERVASDYLIISPPKFGNESFYLPVGAEISVVFYRSDGILYGHSKILAKQSGDDARLKISKPYDVELIDRRRSKRTRLTMRAEIEYLMNKNDSNKKVLNVILYDVNAYGMSYIDTEPLGKYQSIKTRIYMKNDLSNPVQAECKYVYSCKKEIKGAPMYKTALEFSRISEVDVDRLKEKCYRKSYV